MSGGKNPDFRFRESYCNFPEVLEVQRVTFGITVNPALSRRQTSEQEE